jgi:hypothetical protein
VALNPLCDLAGYALAPASVIAPVTGMDIAWAAQLTQLVPGEGGKFSGNFGGKVGVFLVNMAITWGFSHIFFIFSRKN